MTTLDDLKRAIGRLDEYHTLSLDLKLQYAHGHAIEERDAWRTAFGWREDWRKRCQGIALQSIQWSAHCEEGDEGMALIREKLR